MIENTCNKIVGRMITNGIISADECALYSYHIQVMLEAIVGHVIILTSAFILGYFVEVLLFLFSFGVLRGSTSGYHCKTSVGCVLLSSLSCAIVVGLQNFALSHILYYQGGLIISMIIIILVGAINHPDMEWSDDELKSAQRSARIKVVFLLILLSVLNYLGIEKIYLYYLGMGVVQCSISLVIVKFKRKGGSDDEEES